LASGVAHYLRQERQAIEREQEVLTEMTPYKKGAAAKTE
jgi:predicted N-acyltransferase